MTIDRRRFLLLSAMGATAVACSRPAQTPPNSASAVSCVPQPIIQATPVVDSPFAVGPLWTTSIFDDFDGALNSQPDSDLWLIDTVNQGGIQTYTTSTNNVRLDGNSHLILEVRADHTSGRVTTRTKAHFGYGRILASMKMPNGVGFNPSIWMFGEAWPDVGEIDIVELPRGTAWCTATIHDITPPMYHLEQDKDVSDLSQDFHEYWCIRTPNHIQIGVDSITIADWTREDFSGNWDVFERPMYVNMTLALGTTITGPPDQTTPYPSVIVVNWFKFEPYEPDNHCPLTSSAQPR